MAIDVYWRLPMHGCKGDWSMYAFRQRAIQRIREQVGNKKVLCAVSGGVDSSVAAGLSAGTGAESCARLHQIRRIYRRNSICRVAYSWFATLLNVLPRPLPIACTCIEASVVSALARWRASTTPRCWSLLSASTASLPVIGPR